MKFVAALVLSIVVAAVLALPAALLGGWLLMVAIGIIHLHVLPAVHPIGYWLSVALAFLLKVALGSTTPANTES